MGDIKNMGSPVGLISKLTSFKSSSATVINAALAKAGVDIDDLSNPINADKISKVTNSISDPKIIKDIADQFGVTPPGGLPEVGKQSFAALTAANPFAGAPSYQGADSSLNTGAASALLGGAPAPIVPSPVEASADPAKWALSNDLTPPPAIDAVVSRTQTVTDFEGGSWQVFGSVVTKTGATSFKIYGSTGGIVTEGSAKDVIGLVNQLPRGEDDFVERVINTIKSMESSFKSSYPRR
jgi:hypothetical protein